MAPRKKKNPNFVTLKICNQRHLELSKSITEILHILKGDPNKFDDLGLLGAIRDIKRDRKWIYALITLIGLPILFWLLSQFKII